MYNLFNTLRPPNLTLFNLPCLFQPNNMDGRARGLGGGLYPLTFLEDFFVLVWGTYEEQRRGKEKEKGLVKLPHITTDEVMCF